MNKLTFKDCLSFLHDTNGFISINNPKNKFLSEESCSWVLKELIELSKELPKKYNLIINSPRQSGRTTIALILSILAALYTPNQTIVHIGLSTVDCMNKLDSIKAFLNANQINVDINNGVHFDNGSSILFETLNSMRCVIGKRIDIIIIDNADMIHHSNKDMFNYFLKPLITIHTITSGESFSESYINNIINEK